MTKNTPIHFATFNVSLSADVPGQIRSELESNSKRIQKLAATIQSCRPDVLLLCEFDHPGKGGDDGSLALFCERYLEVGQFGQDPVYYPHRYLPPTNTGLPVFSSDDASQSPEKAQGFGRWHGQYGFVVLSRFPLLVDEVKTWQHFLWKDLPNNAIPKGYYSDDVLEHRRVSSKNHIALPIDIHGHVVTLVACHPTPPVFDGPEKRNYRRNADELKLLEAIISNEAYLVDDEGKAGGVTEDMPFVIMGDLNADSVNGDGDKEAIASLLNHERTEKSVRPCSNGAVEYLSHGEGENKALATHNRGLRLDYVLPSTDFNILNQGVFWPSRQEPLHSLITDSRGRLSFDAPSDHRLVWLDVTLN
ncbi:endonuclease/exonuclease/phosphatase family protein [Enterovibrio coralii]|nr:endonuclease/exonuclease/phosphatase family protein [Enterovibrio coralii]